MTESAPTRRPSLVSAAMLHAGLYLRNTVLRPRSLVVLGLVALDIVIALAWRQGGDAEVPAEAIFVGLANESVLGFVLPFMALLYGIAVVRDEAEGGTLSYHLMRPIPRYVFFVSRLGVAAGVTLGVVLLLMGAHVAIIGGGPSAGALQRILVALLLGSLAYTAFFAAAGAFFKRPFLMGVLALLLVDLPVSRLPMGARHVTLRANLEAIAGLHPEKKGLAALLDTSIPLSASYATVLVVLAATLALGIFAFAVREHTGDIEQ